MALVKFGAMITDARGSIAGTTFSRNGSGAYTRARVKPTNANTPDQQRARSNFSSCTTDWNDGALTESQRQAWRDYALNVGWLNKLGETITLNGNSMYVRSNVARLTAGLTKVSDGPTDFTLVGADETFAISVSEATQQVTVTFDDTRDWTSEDGAALSMFMGVPQNAGVNSFDGPFRFAAAELGDSVTPATSPITFAVVSPVTAGQKVWVEARILRADGRVSRTFRSSATVSA